MISVEPVIAALADFRSTRSVADAARDAPGRPGLYAIHLTDADRLPEPFRSRLVERGTRLLYVGQASESLHERLVRQELQHRRAATFFRGLGALLGYRPVAGSLFGKANQNNYRFGKADTDAIVRWMGHHLRASWVVLPQTVLDTIEVAVIRHLRPLLNTTHNPDCCADLARVRDECRRIARSE